MEDGQRKGKILYASDLVKSTKARIQFPYTYKKHDATYPKKQNITDY